MAKYYKNTLLIALLSAGVLLFYYTSSQRHHVPRYPAGLHGVYLSLPASPPVFHLTDHTGKPFTSANLKGHWTLVFFGFSHCAMVCPVTLAALREMYETLQLALGVAKLPQIVFVSIDPERDTLQRLNEYISAFHPRFIGARADRQETESLMRQLRVVSMKMQMEDDAGRYSFDHSSDIFVFNPAGQLQAYLTYPHQAKQLVKDYQSILTVSADLT